MEERVPHPTTLDPLHDRDLPLPSETYVVQIPKDQIYRVPPPENALLVEQYRKPAKAKSNGKGSGSCCCCCCCGWVFCVVITVVLVLVIGLAVALNLFSLFTKAQDPIFHVESFRAKNVTGGHEFDIGFMAENPNKYTDVLYKLGGETSLAFKQKKIASGKFPTFLQGKKSIAEVNIALRDSGGKSPAEINTGMANKKTGPHLSFTLRVTVTARMKAGFFQQHDVSLSISCDYTVDKLTGGTRILSEECLVERG